jgi:hypothetical protein
LRAPVVEDDVVLQADELEKGELVLLDERGWFHRFRQLEARNLVSTFLTYLIVFEALAIVLGMWSGIFGLFFFSTLGLAWAVGLTLLSYVSMRRTIKAVRRKCEEVGKLPGLYEHGIIFPDTFLYEPTFVPYSDMTDISFHRSLSGESVKILYGPAKLGHRVPLVFLGNEGLDHLRSNIGKGPPPRMPPQLVLYPTPDTASSQPSESEDAD